MDLDGDGRSDVVSGSWPGELYVFRRKPDGSFAARESLRDSHGEIINLGSASTIFAIDWDGDRDLDLLVGNIDGDVQVIPNQSGGTELAFGDAVQLFSLRDQKLSDAHPVAADWNNDGILDVLIGHGDGGVVWCRGSGPADQRELSPPVELIPNSPSPWSEDRERQPSDWGVRSKICVVDWNRDGWLDVVLGDYCGRFTADPEATPHELAVERAALARLPNLRKAWAATYRQYRALLNGKSNTVIRDRESQLQTWETQLRKLKDEISHCQRVQAEFQPQRQAHGFIWLFLRRPVVSKFHKCTNEISERANRE